MKNHGMYPHRATPRGRPAYSNGLYPPSPAPRYQNQGDANRWALRWNSFRYFANLDGIVVNV